MIDLKHETTDNISINEIRDFQREKGIILPSDYIFLLTNFHELKITGDLASIYSKEKEELSVLFSEIWGLKRFAMFNFDWDEDFHDTFNFKTDEYFGIADVAYQGILLIGNTSANLNKIYIDLPETESAPIELAENFFTFLKENIQVTE